MAIIDSRSAGILSVLERSNTETPINSVRSFIANVTGIDMKLVRQAWLSYPGKQPGLSETWCAVQQDYIKPLATPLFKDKKGDREDVESGDTTVISHEEIGYTVSFYGADALLCAGDLVAGLQIGQNLSELSKNGLSLRAVDEQIDRRPDSMLNQWIDRYVVTFRLCRKTSRRYGVRTLSGFSSETVKLITEKDD